MSVPAASDEDSEIRGDLRAAVQMLAADNARLCGIALAGDELAKVLAAYRHSLPPRARQALDKYKIARQGQ